MTKASNIDAIEKTTEMTWEDWVSYLNGIGAADLPHPDIADKVREKLSGKLENAGWWAQSVTVAYEQEIGRRAPGQRSDGTYEFSVSKTMDCSMDEAMEAWLQYANGKSSFNHVDIAKAPTTSGTDKRRHWGCGLADGTRLNIDVYPKTPEKTVLYITQQKLTSQTNAESWKTYWKSVLEEI